MEKKINYNYGIKYMFNKDTNRLSETYEYNNIILCVYKINTIMKLPFIQYLLFLNQNHELSLIHLPIYNNFKKEDLIDYFKVFLFGLLKIDDFETFDNNIDFDGFYEHNNKLYLFIDITNCTINVEDTYLSSPVRFGLIDEITNHKNICNIPIDEDTTIFFITNSCVNYLHDDETYNIIETPIVAYSGKSTTDKLQFGYIFGESAKTKLGILGPYYYFTDFCYSIRQGGWSSDYKPECLNGNVITDTDTGRYKNGGIIRYALFIGKIKYIENLPNDENDLSEIKYEKLNDPECNVSFENLISRISDHDGLWSNTYDSVYLGNIELDDGSYIQDAPIIATKNFNQQQPLSIHYINKNKLGNKFDRYNNNYSIV